MESILGQDYGSFEYIVVDGASTDATLDILKETEDPRLRWVSAPDDGISDAWNKGLHLARGKWITFIGADDVLLPGALTSLMSLANLFPEAQYLSGKVEWVGTHGERRIIGRQWRWPEFQKYNCTAHPASMHHRDLFSQFGLFDTALRIVFDYELLLRPGKHLKSAYLPQILLRMQGGGNSDNTDALREAALVKRRTGKRAAGLVALELAAALTKFHIRNNIQRLARLSR